MSSTPPASDLPPPRHPRDWLPSRRGLLLMALAFVAGLVLFAVVWRGEMRNDFYTVEPVARPSSVGEFEPLPAPLPANRDRGASGLSERERELAAEREREQARAAERPPEPPVPVASPEPPPAPLPSTTPAAATVAPAPLPGQSPPPNYPRRALRRGDEGVVLLRVDVGPDGIPTSVGIVRSSRSRDLDRAAIDAVERWRFRPAMADGRPTVGSVEVPIEFSARR